MSREFMGIFALLMRGEGHTWGGEGGKTTKESEESELN